MDREYFQHAVRDAVQEAVRSVTTITTHALAIATGMMALYVFVGGPFVASGISSVIDIARVG